MKIHLLSGFLGSGKTTAIHQACAMLIRRGLKVGVVTNDQGIKLVDSYFFKNAGIPERQVSNGCFCCNYSDLDTSIDSLISVYQPDVIFAESVGSCTDIVATVVKPILKFRKPESVTLTTIVDARLLQMMMNGSSAFDEEVQYIYFKQLEEAQMIVINKIDLVNEKTLQQLKDFLSEKYQDKRIIEQNSLMETYSRSWLDHISGASVSLTVPSLDIDYDTYASGEAKMGYLDQQLIIRSKTQDAELAAIMLMKTFTRLITESGSPVGHIKFWMNNKHKLSFTSVTDKNVFTNIAPEATDTCTMIVNARLETEPEALVSTMEHSIMQTEDTIPVTIEKVNTAYFRPGYPKPLHRISD